jgi:hypothetical protein
LTLARSRLTKLGFTVAPDAQHPFGTANCCVFFRNQTYLEPITTIDRHRADVAAAEGVIFVKRLKRYNERRGEGFAMVALKSDDAAADSAAFTKKGAEPHQPARFARMARLPNGSEREVGFVDAFANFPTAPDATLFVCQHLAADVIFQPAYLEHPNSAAGVVAVVAVAERPVEFQAMLATAAGKKPAAIEGGIEARLKDGQSLLVLDREAFRRRYDLDAPNPRQGLVFAASEVAVLDLDRAAGYAGGTAQRREGSIVLPLAPGLGTVLVFKEKADA